jgi:hypothetical protein
VRNGLVQQTGRAPAFNDGMLAAGTEKREQVGLGVVSAKLARLESLFGFAQGKLRRQSPRDSLRLLFPAAHLQVGADEGLQVAVDHPVHVADFHLGAMVFYQAIRLQNVRANL